MSSKAKEDQNVSIFDQLLDQLIDRIDSETGCVRSVYDHGVEYNIYQAQDNDLTWYLAITDDGMAIGFGLSYELVVKQAEAYVMTQRECECDFVCDECHNACDQGSYKLN